MPKPPPHFAPIAIVGRACLLPGAPTPEALWEAVSNGRDLIGHAPPGRWRLSHRHAMGTPAAAEDRTWSDRGGYVRDFDAHFDPDGFRVPARALQGLDPVFTWALHTGRAAWRDAGSPDPARAGVVLGNLSFPSSGMSRFAERQWLGPVLADAAGIPATDPRNRFMSGLPAHLLARALGLGGAAFALDAACASSLYAIKLACDRLLDGASDVMLAGAVNAADDLFIHVGFCALKAMSPTGQSRPFHRDADGLVPAEGCAMVVLKRLADARADGDTIHGIIRGIGLSNDGRGRGFLAPAVEGQLRAMRAAWDQSGLSPERLGLLECHATGTTVGDAAELRSAAEMFAGCQDLPVGSLKSNLGHLITAAGAAGLIKVLEAMRAGSRPASIGAEVLNPAVEGTSLRVLDAQEPWVGPRLAAVSAFGFGGNNAHLIVEGVSPSAEYPPIPSVTPRAPTPIACLRVEIATDPDEISLALRGLRFPPKDLEQSLPQQLLLLAVVRRAIDGLALPRERTAILVGMGTDPEVARYGARWRLADWARDWQASQPEWVRAARDGVVPLLESAGVVGTMPNIVANRLNSQFDLAGPSLTFSSEQLSGVRALEAAVRALRVGEIDAAIVGAVDMSREPVHVAALVGLGVDAEPADGAVVLVLTREEDAGTAPYGRILSPDTPAERSFDPSSAGPHAASGLLAVARALREEGRTRLSLSALGHQSAVVVVEGAVPPTPAVADSGPAITYPAHWSPVSLPAFPARAATPAAPTGREGQTLSPAPALPPVFGRPALPPAPVAPVRPPPVLAAVPLVPGYRARFVAHQKQVSALHQRFVHSQADVHRRFLELRQRGLQLLLDGARGGALPSGPQALVPAPLVIPEAPARPRPPARPAPPPSPALPPPVTPTTVLFDRAALEVHASGRISEIFGPLFEQQDGWDLQVRMPEPPLLLADRVVGLDAKPGSMAKGSIRTETDVTWDAWYLHEGRMPAGIMIESGQADLMLISYLGIDFLNRGERAYRLLGCELTYHGGLPRPGDTLHYDILVDGHARQGDIRLFFFHYDCTTDGEPRLTVRKGQAGFFDTQELAESLGVLWDAETGEKTESPRLDAPAVDCARTALSRAQLEAWAAGRLPECFGPGFEHAWTHTRTPKPASGRMLLLDEVTHLERGGGPWGRGYLRAIDPISPDDWFFEGHFHNDPCMPGTLMFEGCLQAMATYLTSLGYTLDADGWRFEPVPDVAYPLRCRGQVTPTSRELVYEIFVDGVEDGPYPTLWADLLCTVDGLKAFHCRRMGLRLVPSWPLEARPELLADYVEPKPVASADGFDFDYASLLACAWGRPSHAFGPMYEVFDDTRRVARLPGPPYHFMSRVTHVDGRIGVTKPGAVIEIEYDLPPNEWYFRESGAPFMPFCVLLEAALQPCGWLASFVGSATTTEQDLFFRNLDGTGIVHRELGPHDGTMLTRTKITSISRSAGMIIESFEVQCTVDGDPLYDLKTVFGFFPKAALAEQKGLPVSDEQRALLTGPCEENVDLTAAPPRYFGGSARLPEPYLLMLDRASMWPTGGKAGLGRFRGEKDVDPNEWFFKAHFFQDPVQPGSLGIEAMIQLLQLAMIRLGMTDSVPGARFESLALHRPMTWKYRGQVRPHNKLIGSTLDIVEVGTDDDGCPFAVAEASLWVDGLRIYEARDLAMRVVSDPDGGGSGELLDPAKDRWINDHRPTWTVPALPMMSMVDRLADAAAGVSDGALVIGMESVRVLRWAPINGPTRLDTEATRDGDRVAVVLKADGEPICQGTVLLGTAWPEAPAPLPALDAPAAASPYQEGTLFHGPAFQVLDGLRMAAGASSGSLRAGHALADLGPLNPILLDGATHTIPHDGLAAWSPELPADMVAYPALIPRLRLFGPTPRSGQVRCETRYDGVFGGPRFPSFRLQLIADERVWAELLLVEAMFPKGRIGSAPPLERREFLRDRRWTGRVALSTVTDGVSRLDASDVIGSDWLPGTIAALYGTQDPVEIATREHLARRVGHWPGHLPSALPLNDLPVRVETADGRVSVRDAGPEALDLAPVEAFWAGHFGLEQWPVADLYYGLLKRFVRRVVVADPAAFDAVRGRSLVYAANHQVGVESLLFSILASGLSGVTTATLAKAEHRETWLGRLIAHCFSYPGVADPGSIVFFDRADPASLPTLLADIGRGMAGQGKSLMAHVEGTRALSCARPPVERMSGAIIDLALKAGAPVVPVRFVGGLPVEAVDERLEFPVGMGAQDVWIGRPMLPAELEALPYAERARAVIEAIATLGPAPGEERPLPPDLAFQAKVRERADAGAADEVHAVLGCVLAELKDPCEETRALLDPRGSEPLSPWSRELARRLGCL